MTMASEAQAILDAASGVQGSTGVNRRRHHGHDDRKDSDIICYIPEYRVNQRYTVASYSPYTPQKVCTWTLTSDQMALFMNFSSPTKDELKLFVMLYPKSADDVIIDFKMEGYREKEQQRATAKSESVPDISEVLRQLTTQLNP